MGVCELDWSEVVVEATLSPSSGPGRDQPPCLLSPHSLSQSPDLDQRGRDNSEYKLNIDIDFQSKLSR